MPKDIAIAGVYITPYVGFYLLAFAIFLIVRLLIVPTNLERIFWRPEIAETGLFLIILSMVARVL